MTMPLEAQYMELSSLRDSQVTSSQIQNLPHNVITFSETWLNSNIPDNDAKLDNYVLYRSDRGSRGGRFLTKGVLIGLKSGGDTKLGV